MALSSSRYFSKGKVGLGGSTASLFNKFALDSTPQYNVGFQVTEADGSMYRYVHFGAATNRGLIVAGDLSETSVVDTDNAVIAPASAVTTTDGTVGSKFVQITLASVVADQFAGAKFVVTDDTGEGYTYDVVGNTATNDPATGDIRLELQQPLQVALDATSDIAIAANPYHNLEAATAATDIGIVGVSCATASADDYGWIQTQGQIGILQDGAIAIGNKVSLSDGVAGAVQLVDAETETEVGFCVIAGDTTGHGVFKVSFE